MSVSRRTFIKTTVAAGSLASTFWFETDSPSSQPNQDCSLPTPGPARPFVPNEPKVVARVSAFTMADSAHAAQLTRFRSAVGQVRSRPATDVIGWTKQVAQHCIQCDPSGSALIHYNWQFLPWHRALLYFHERILRAAVNDDDLRLVYWDWENPASRGLPQIYLDANQPLLWNNRNLAGPDWPLKDDAVDVTAQLAVPTFDIFGGTVTPYRPVPTSFSGPHASVHNAFLPGDMGDLQYSPRDPVFFAHHCNIDRMWTSWLKAVPNHQNPDFGDAKVYFYDEQRQWRSILQNDLRDERKLGYTYPTLMQPAVPLQPLEMFSALRSGSDFVLESRMSSALSSRAGSPAFLLIENLHNLEQLPTDTVRYGIFAGSSPVGAAVREQANFIGIASRPASREHAHVDSLSASIRVTGKLGMLLSDQRFRDLRVVPVDANSRTTGEGIALEADRVSIIG